ncbi:MAG: hypothetical protein ACTII3_06005 [Galactobacter sp.]
MARIDRLLPAAVVLTVAAGFVLPTALAWRGNDPDGLPAPAWGRLLEVTARSLVLPVAASTLALVLAAAVVTLAYTTLSRTGRRILLGLLALPFVFPPVVIAAAVHEGLGQAILLLSSTLVALPMAVAGQVLGLRFVDSETLMLTRSLGLPVFAAWRKAVIPLWSRGAFLAWAWSVLQLFSDPGVPDVYGGNWAYLASHSFRAVSSGQTGAPVMRAVLFTMVLAVIICVILTRPRFWRIVGSGPRNARFPVSDLLRSAPVPGWVKVSAGVVSGVVVVAVLGLIGVIAAGAIRSTTSEPIQLAPILATVLLVLVAVPAGVVIAFVFSLSLRRASRFWRRCGIFLLLLMIFSSPTAIGAVLGTVLRRPVSVEGFVLLPALVGGGSVANGWFGLLIATLAVCVPASSLVMLALLSTRPSTAIRSARSLGAGPLRTLFTTGPMYLKPLVVASVCVQMSASLTSLSPQVLVQPGGTSLATPYLFGLIAGGRTDEAFGLAAVTGVVTCIALSGILLLLRMSIDTDFRARNKI